MALGKNFSDDPIIGQFITNRYARLVLLAVFIQSGFLFLFTWWNEQQQGAKVEWLSTATGRRAILAAIMSSRLSDHSGSDVMLSFSFSDAVRAIQGRSRLGSSVLLPISRHLSTSSAEQLAQMHLDELERQGTIRRMTGKQIDVRYEIEHSLARELAKEHPGSWD